MTTLLRETLTRSSIYMPTPARVVEVTSFTPVEKWFHLELPSGYKIDHQPGQFIEVSVFGIGEAPISICSPPLHSNGAFELCVRRVGKLTSALHRLQPGDMLAVRGPFGHGFPVERFHGKDIIFVAGGLGLAPLRSLITQVLAERGNYGRIALLYGARTPHDFLFPNDLNTWSRRQDVECHITVDFPAGVWRGPVGVITTLLPRIKFPARNTVAAIVGPPIMYRFVLKELLASGIAEGNIWLSFERQMKCGVGKCGHCQIHHLYTCQKGPVLSYADVKQLDEALS